MIVYIEIGKEMKAFILLFLLLSNLFVYAKEHVVLLIGQKHSFEFAGFYMAKQKGYYKDAGLDVSFKLTKSNKEIVEQVKKADAMYAVGDTSLVYYEMKDPSYVALMPILNSSDIAFVTPINSLKSIEDANDSDIRINADNFLDISLLSMLYMSGINPDSITIDHSNFNIDDITHDKQAIFAVSKMDQPYLFRQKGIPLKIFTPKELNINFYEDILFTSKDEVISHPKRVKAFVDATKRGWRYAMAHIDETISTILKRYDTKTLTKKDLYYQAELIGENLSKDFTFDREKILEMERLYKIIFKDSKMIKSKNFIYNPYIFTTKESNFVKTNTIRCVSTGNWAPFNLMQNGKLSGIALDYWNIIKKRLSLKTKCDIVDNFSEVLSLIKNKKADITISTTKIDDRERYAVFSKPYLKAPIVIVTRNSMGFVPDIKSIKDKVFAMPKDYTTTKILTKNFPHIKYFEVKDIDEALKYVSSGRADATLGILPVVAYKINDLRFTNLKISGTTKYLFPVRFMIRKDYSILIPMINRVIDSIKEDTKEQIYQKWITVHMQEGYSKKKVLSYAIVGMVVILLLLLWMVTLYIQIQKRKKAEQKLQELATIDKLTSIYNRYMIDISLAEHIEIAKRYRKELSLIFFDIDHFKKVNDRYGHKVGDIVLKEIALLVKKKIRKSDIFGRWGGEEFLLILPEVDIKRAVYVAEELRKDIKTHTFDMVGHITCSFGVTSAKEDDTIDSLMRRVDDALYKAKENGRDKVCID